MARQSRNRVLAFDFDEALAFEGDTGPYLQYSAVRAGKIFGKLMERRGEGRFMVDEIGWTRRCRDPRRSLGSGARVRAPARGRGPGGRQPRVLAPRAARPRSRPALPPSLPLEPGGSGGGRRRCALSAERSSPSSSMRCRCCSRSFSGFRFRRRCRGSERVFRSSGLLGRPWRPSVAPSAWSRGGMIEGLRPRRWYAGGLLLSRESQAEARSPREPGTALCAAHCPPEGRTGTMPDLAPRCGALSAFCRGSADIASTGRAVLDHCSDSPTSSSVVPSGRTMSRGAIPGSAPGESGSGAP